MKINLPRIWKRIRGIRSDSDLDDELRAHLELAAEDNLATGLGETEARRRAQFQLGRTRPSLIESIRDQDFITAFESWYRDLLFGLRSLRKAPVFCITSVLTLGLGIGANTAVFSVLYGLLLRSLPVPNPAQLARLGFTSPAIHTEREGAFLSYGMFQEFSKRQKSFAAISGWDSERVTLKDKEGTLRIYDAGLVTGNAFGVLAIKPYIGRLIEPSDDVPKPHSTEWRVVLSYGFWKAQFSGDPRAIGKRITANGLSFTVIGVTPPDFQGVWPGLNSKLYLPLQFFNTFAGHDVLNVPSSMVGISPIGRLKPGVSVRDASAEIAVYTKQLLDTVPLAYRGLPELNNLRFQVKSARTGLPSFFGSTYSRPLFLLQGLVGIVLVLCCVNVGGLMISKLYARQREFAVRIAIGAARWRLIRQYLTESLVIALAGALLGAFLAWYGAVFLLQFFRHPNMFEGMSVRPDAAIFWVTGLLAVLTTLFFGTLPAWRAGRSDAGILLRSRSTMGGRRQITGRAFVPVQVALSVTLVALATLLSQSLAHLRGENTGFDVDHVTIQTPPLDGKSPEARLDLYQRMVDRISELPGVQSAAVTWYTPMTGDQATARFEAVTNNSKKSEGMSLAYNAVGPGYFRTMRTAILSGREFAKNERQDTVCVLNESAAKALFPREAALGQYLRGKNTKAFPKPVSCRVVGIAQDAKFASLRVAPPATVYFPVSTQTLGDAGVLVFLIHSGTKAQAIAAYRTALHEISPSTPLVLFVTLREQMDAALGSQRLITVMSNFFAAVALLLSALGLYGLLSSSVAQRTGEIGVRMALGAERFKVLRMILSEALRLLGWGILVGAGLLFFAVRFVQNMLYGVSAFDPPTLLATTLLLTAVALLAAFAPALHAASVDPIDALRVE